MVLGGLVYAILIKGVEKPHHPFVHWSLKVLKDCSGPQDCRHQPDIILYSLLIHLQCQDGGKLSLDGLSGKIVQKHVLLTAGNEYWYSMLEPACIDSGTELHTSFMGYLRPHVGCMQIQMFRHKGPRGYGNYTLLPSDTA